EPGQAAPAGPIIPAASAPVTAAPSFSRGALGPAAAPLSAAASCGVGGHCAGRAAARSSPLATCTVECGSSGGRSLGHFCRRGSTGGRGRYAPAPPLPSALQHDRIQPPDEVGALQVQLVDIAVLVGDREIEQRVAASAIQPSCVDACDAVLPAVAAEGGWRRNAPAELRPHGHRLVDRLESHGPTSPGDSMAPTGAAPDSGGTPQRAIGRV